MCVVVPEVTLTADRTRVRLGDRVTLTCNVTRANPMPTTYTWTHVDSNTALSETSSTLTFPSITTADIATYRCEGGNVVGTGMDNITITLGGQSHDPHVMLCVYSLLVQLSLT